MKTTIDIPDPLYRQAKIRAVQIGSTLKELVVSALRHELQNPTSSLPTEPSAAPEADFFIDEQGWPILKRSVDDKTVITEEFINRLREEEGV
jgi:predicted HD phosphohydrolase